jgi:hypothetical protein
MNTAETIAWGGLLNLIILIVLLRWLGTEDQQKLGPPQVPKEKETPIEKDLINRLARRGPRLAWAPVRRYRSSLGPFKTFGESIAGHVANSDALECA